MWICEHCDEKVPDNFSQCWKCQTEKGKKRPSDLIENIDNEKHLKIDLLDNKELNLKNIIVAGKFLRKIVIVVIVFSIINIIIGIIAFAVDTGLMYMAFVSFSILEIIIILSQIYGAGSSLENIVQNKKEKSKDKK